MRRRWTLGLKQGVAAPVQAQLEAPWSKATACPCTLVWPRAMGRGTTCRYGAIQPRISGHNLTRYQVSLHVLCSRHNRFAGLSVQQQ